jgi:chorismate mutase
MMTTRVRCASRCGALAASAGWAVFVAILLVGEEPARADATRPLIELVDAAAQRLQIAEPVAAVKWSAHGAIDDPARVQQELNTLGADATAQRIDPGYVIRVFTDQINATEAIEYARFADWQLNPSDVPAAPPNLSASRSTIDGLNQTMLTQLAHDWDLLHSSACALQLDAARRDVIRSRQLDNLYQRALSSATESYCA